MSSDQTSILPIPSVAVTRESAEPFEPTRTHAPAMDIGTLTGRLDASDLAGREPQPIPQLPDYEILGELGRGGMGVVYLARQTAIGRQVALKMILAGGFAAPEARQRFLAEAEAVAKIQHPGIVQLYDFGQHEGRPFFSLEFVPGGSLHQLIKGKPQSPEDSARFVEKLALAMKAAHAKGIIHRDLKPANILLSPDTTVSREVRPGQRPSLDHFQPKITDFGLVKTEDQNLTASGAMLGTPGYMAPEQASGTKGKIGPATDVYALGAILYELLTGRPPFMGASPIETIALVFESEPIPPRRLVPTVPRDLETICLKCLQKEPAKRYGSAKELAEDLNAFLDHRPIAARPVGTMEQAWKWVRRHPVTTCLAAALVLVLLGSFFGLTALYLNAEKERTEAERQRNEANKQRAAAETQKAEAEKQRKEADEQRRIAIEERKKADEFFAGTQAMNAFLIEELLLVARPDGGQVKKDITLREKLDHAGPKIDLILEDHPELASNIHLNFGQTYHHLGVLAKAEEHLRRAVDLRVEHVGKEEAATANAQYDLARTLQYQSKFEEALPLYQAAFSTLRKKLGEDADETLGAELGLADCLRLMRRSMEAEPHYAHALSSARRVLGASHPRTLQSLAAYGDLLANLERLKDAEAIFREVYEILKARNGEEHRDTIAIQMRWADMLYMQGQLDQAEPILRRNLELRKQHMDEKHPTLYTVISTLAELADKKGRHDEAEKLYREAIEGYRRSMPADSPLIPFTQIRLAICLTNQGKLKEADELLTAGQAGYEKRRSIIPFKRWQQLYNARATLCDKQGNREEAKDWRAKAAVAK